MLKRVTKTARWTIALSVPIGLLAIEPLASYIYSEMAGYPFAPLLWVSGLVYEGAENQAVMLSGLGGLAGGIGLIAFVTVTMLPPKPLHGSARLARTGEITGAGLYKAPAFSVLLGRHRGKLIAFNGDLHPFLAAATGTGKGIGFVVPNLLHWGGSMICLDIKGENFALTSGYRGEVLGQKVFRFDPLQEEGRTHGFNPLAYVRDSELRVTDIQTIAAILVPPEGNDPYWSNTARDLVMGLLLLVVEAGPAKGWPVTIGQAHRLIRTEQESGEYLSGLIATLDGEGVAVSDLCRRYILGFCNEPEKPRGSIKSSLVTKLTLWSNPLIDRATSRNDFDLRMFRREAMTVYLAIAPDDLARIGQLVRLLIEFFLSVNTKAGETPADDAELKVPVLLLLDEFLSLGKMEKLVQSLAYVRGWGIRIATVIQSEAQLQALYGKELAEFFIDNHRARVYFRPPVHRRDMAEEISKLVGNTTVRQTSYGYGKGPRTRNVSEAGQAILDADEIANLTDTETIVLVEGLRPFIGEKIRYYRDKLFRQRRLPSLPFPQVQVVDPEAALGDDDLECLIERADDDVTLETAEALEAALEAVPRPLGVPSDEELAALAEALWQVTERAGDDALRALPSLIASEEGGEEAEDWGEWDFSGDTVG